MTTRAARSRLVRKSPVMRVEHDGEYAIITSMGGAPTNPAWNRNLVATPDAVTIQDGPEPFNVTVREVTGAERETWWARAVAAFPPYADYKERTERVIPVLIATRRTD